jgi:hypothetical protein
MVLNIYFGRVKVSHGSDVNFRSTRSLIRITGRKITLLENTAGYPVAVILGLFCAGIFVAHAVDAYLAH